MKALVEWRAKYPAEVCPETVGYAQLHYRITPLDPARPRKEAVHRAEKHRLLPFMPFAAIRRIKKESMNKFLLLPVLSLLFLSAFPSRADIPVTYDDIVNLYGPYVPGTPTTPAFGFRKPPTGTKFRSNGIDIEINPQSDRYHIQFIRITRSSSFSEFEIPDLLKPLSGGEDWVPKGDKTWILPKAKVSAVWDGEGRITISPQ